MFLTKNHNIKVFTNAFYNTIHLSRTKTTGRALSSSSLFWNNKDIHNNRHYHQYPFINKSLKPRSLHSLSSAATQQQEEKEETTKTSSTSIGTLVSYETSTNGNNGIAIVKLNYGDNNNNDSSSLGDDYTGRSVQFHTYNHNDEQEEIDSIINGIVLIQRTPYLFIYYMDNDMHNLFTSNTTFDNVKVKLSSSKQCIYYDINDIKDNVVDYPTLQSKSKKSKRELYATIPNVSEIELINEPCLTGFTSIDTMCPIGKGQNMLFISNDDTIKRNVIYDIIATQQNNINNTKTGPMKIIYGSTSYTGREKQIILGDLIDKSLLDDIIFVTTEDNELLPLSSSNEDDKDCIVSAAEGICIALSSCSIGELYARDNDSNNLKDVLIVIDTIHPFKILWDYTTRYLLQLQQGEEDDDSMDEEKAMIASKSSDSEMRSYFSNIIQRSCNLKQNIGGSISLLLFANEPTNPSSSKQQDSDNYSFTMDDFESTIFKKNDNNDKLRQRIQILLDRNIPLTMSNCQKLDIPIPPISTSNNDVNIIKYNQYKSSLKFIDDLISMTDGQIYLDTTTSQQKQQSSVTSFKLPKYPPINIQKSLTRIGIGKDTVCRADAKVIQKISSGLRLELLYGLDNIFDLTTKKRIRYQAYLNIMEQYNNNANSDIRSLVDSVILILAVKLGFMDTYVIQEGNELPLQSTTIIKDLLHYVNEDKSTKSVLKTIQDTYDFSNDIEDEQVLNDCITSFFSQEK